MPTFTFLQPFGTWPFGTMMAGFGTPTTTTTTEMTYTSTEGFTLTMQGAGFAYDDNLVGNDGAVTRIVVSQNGVDFADFTGLDLGLQRLCTLVFGQDLGGMFAPPDPAQFEQVLLRGNDSIIGTSGSDRLTGGIGNDTISAATGRDFITADAGNDLLDGGGDRDTLSFDVSYSDFTAYRGVNLNALTGKVTDCWGAKDTISGFEVFQDSVFSDLLIGSAVGERFFLTRGNDRADGGGGYDILSYENAQAHGAVHGVRINLATGLVRDAWGGTDQVSNFEQVRGTNFADSMNGSAADEDFVGGAGVDVIKGGSGFDVDHFFFADDDPQGHGASVDMRLVVNVLDDGFGNAETTVGIDGFEGTIYADKFIGNTAANKLIGVDGNDTLSGNGGADTLVGGAGDDSMAGGAGADQFLFDVPAPEAGVDRITDMAAGTDKIAVTPDWGGGLVNGGLVAGQFLSGAGITQATTTDQRFIYNTTTGNLYFDVDGLAGAPGVKFAVLVNHAAITFEDFLVVG